MGEIKWSPTQLDIIESKNKNMLVSAGAGAGKTAVLVEKIIRRVMDSDDPLNINEIMVVTFTEKAALEMKERISRELTKALLNDPGNRRLKAQLQLLNKANISTLHSFCSELLRKYFYWLDLEPDFRIGNEHEIELIKDEILDDYLEELYQESDEIFYGLVDLYGGNMDDAKLKEHILTLHEFSKSTPHPEEWLSKVRAYFDLESETSLENTEYYGHVLEILKEVITKDKKLLDEAMDKAVLPGGPGVYYERLEEEYGALELIEKELDGESDFEKIRELWVGIEFKRLVGIKKGEEVDEDLKEEVKGLRDKVKDEIKSFSQGLFSRPAHELLQELKETSPYMKRLIELVEEFEERFCRVKKKKKLLDYSDLEHEVLKLFQYEEVVLELKEDFKEVMVDEYQDINGVQNEILETISDSRVDDYPYMFMVGDVKQSIYRFRLAEPGLFIEKYYDFKEKQKTTDNTSNPCESEKLIELQENFRSSKKVIDGVNEIFRNVMTKKLGGIDYNQETELKPKKSFPSLETQGLSSDNSVDAGEILYIPKESSDDSLSGEENEASLIAERIRELVDGEYLVYDEDEDNYRSIEYRDIVILNRQLQTHGERISEIFAAKGIPFYAELNKGYFKAPEVQVMLSLLKVIDNPRQDIHLAAVLRSPLVNFSERELFKLCRGEKSSGKEKEKEKASHLDLYDTITAAVESKDDAHVDKKEIKVDEKEIKKIKDFLAKLNGWRTFSRKNRLSELIWEIYETTGYLDFVRGLSDGEERKANLYALYDRALQFDTFSQSGLFRFLRFIEKLEDQGEDLAKARVLSEKDNVVRLMSIHKSKGLEFPLVFVMGLGKNFNTKEIEKDLLIHKELGLGPKRVELDKKIKYPTVAYEVIKEKIRRELLSEELRVLYVALTRAEEHLVLVGSGKGVDSHRSEDSKCYFDWILPAAKESSVFEIYEEDLAGGDYKESRNDREEVKRVEKEAREAPEKSEDIGSGENLHADKIRKLLNWKYPYKNVIDYPAKLTVTQIQRKGLEIGLIETGQIEVERDETGSKDKKASEMSSFRRPAFVEEEERLTGVEVGTAYHLVFEHLPLDDLASWESYEERLEEIRRILLKLKEKEILTEEQVDIIEENKIVDFFETPLGKRVLKNRDDLKRELNFTMGFFVGEIEAFNKFNESNDYENTEKKENGSSENKNVSNPGDKIVVQGAIDYLLSEEDGAVIIDLKTDNIKKDALKNLREKYKTQLKYYKEAVEKIHKERVKEVYLYHIFHGEIVECSF